MRSGIKSLAVLTLLFLSSFSFAYRSKSTEAPGGPGVLGHWSRPDKEAFGSTLQRPVTFTLAHGVLSEVTYPFVDRVQTAESFLVIKSTSGTFDERKANLIKVDRVAGTMVFRVEMQGAGVRLVKYVLADPSNDGIVLDYSIELSQGGNSQIIFVHDPAAERTSGGDTIEVTKSGELTYLRARQKDIRGDEPVSMKPWSLQAVGWTLPTNLGHVGFEGVNSPLERLGRVNPEGYQLAEFGNVAGGLYFSTNETRLQFRVALGFATDATNLESTLERLLKQTRDRITQGQRQQWGSYLGRLQFNRQDPIAEASILVLKSLGDKKFKGAYIAAPAIPSIPWHLHAPEQNYEDSRKLEGDSNSGYRRVWPRDLYHKAMAFLSVGDVASATEVANWYKAVQFSSGMWSQNMWVNGDPSWKAMQLDQTGFPILLIERLVQKHGLNYAPYQAMVQKAAVYLMQRGPGTDQERWEELGGLSPNTLAVAVHALQAAARLEKTAGTSNAAKYNAAAQAWIDGFRTWTLIPNGAFGSQYFARVERGGGKDSWDPSVHLLYSIANKKEGMKSYFSEDEILDGGFLEWIITGLVDPQDPDFSSTLALYDRHVRKQTDAGNGYLRYNNDSYGENFRGGAWPLLSAERGIAAIERGEPYQDHLSFIRRSALSSGMIGEQDTLAVRPLGWSHAAYLIFLKSIQDSRSFYR